MVLISRIPGLSRALTVAAALLILLPLLGWPARARAQENETSPPPPLQWPTLEPGPTTNRGLQVSEVLFGVEDGVNAAVCKKMMTDAGVTIEDPQKFEFGKDCPANFKEQIIAGRGTVRWESGARPTECGTNCVGRPTMGRTMSLNQPNAIIARLFGHFNLRVDVPDGFNRTVRYSYEIQFHCLTNGAREGSFTTRALIDKPIVLRGGIVEGLIDKALAPRNISNSIEAGIRRRTSAPSVPDRAFGSCNSIGVNTTGDPAGDIILYNSPRPRRKPGIRPADDNALSGRSATVRFLRVTRKPVSGFIPPAETGRFHVFLNGVQGNFPDLPGLNLPATGGSAEINLCKTIDMNGTDRLQLIFVNSHGGAVWSQFDPNTNFGAGPARAMTTSRTVKAAGRANPLNLQKGVPRKPEFDILVLREFELLYTIEFNVLPDEVSAPRPVTGSGKKGNQVGKIPDVLITNPGGGQTPQPCRKI